jgi:hypothetical protein
VDGKDWCMVLSMSNGLLLLSPGVIEMTEIITSMEEIRKREWDNLVGKDKVEMQYAWFQFIEHIDLHPEITYCHAIHRHDGVIDGILPAYVHPIYLKQFIRESGFFSVARLMPKMKMPARMIKIHVPLCCDSRFFGNMKFFEPCVQKIAQSSLEDRCIMVVIRDFNGKRSLKHFKRIETFPEAHMNPYPSWDAYIQDQKGKRGKHIRYEYTKSTEHNTKTFLVDDLDGYHDLLYSLFLNVSTKNKSMDSLPPNFFRKMEEYLSPYTRCIFAETDGEINGYLFFLENEYYISCKYAGRTYQESDPYLYFRLIYDLIKYAIKTQKQVSMERTSYDAKFRRGFKAIEKYNYIFPRTPIGGDIYLGLITTGLNTFYKKLENIKSLQE